MSNTGIKKFINQIKLTYYAGHHVREIVKILYLWPMYVEATCVISTTLSSREDICEHYIEIIYRHYILCQLSFSRMVSTMFVCRYQCIDKGSINDANSILHMLNIFMK